MGKLFRRNNAIWSAENFHHGMGMDVDRKTAIDGDYKRCS
jgi:hypothetical protein